MIRGSSRVPGTLLVQAREEHGWTQEELGKKLRPTRFRQYISLCEKQAYLPIRLVKDLDRLFGGDKWRKKIIGVNEMMRLVNGIAAQMASVLERLDALEGIRRGAAGEKKRIIIKTNDN